MYKRQNKVYVANDSGDPPIKDNLIFAVEGTATAGADGEPTFLLFFTRGAQPTWAELRWASVYRVFSNTADDTFDLASVHSTSKRILIDDQNSVRTVGNDPPSFANPFPGSPAIDRYSMFYNSRFALAAELGSGQGITQGDFGTLEPGYLAAEVGAEAYLRMIRLQCEADFSFDVLRLMTTRMIGSSLREVRNTFLELAGMA